MFLSSGERDLLTSERKMLLLFVIFITTILVGAVGYAYFEGRSVVDTLPMAATSAVAYEFSNFKNDRTIILGVFVMILEWACIWGVFDNAVELVSQGKVKSMLEGDHIKKQVGKMNNHFIIAGFGRVGAEIARNLSDAKQGFVVIERDPEAVSRATRLGYPVVCGDIVSEDTLHTSGIQKARALIIALGRDADNVLLTLTARGMNPRVRIIARAENKDTVKKLKQAGAADVLLPSVIGGKAMAAAALEKNYKCEFED